LKLEKNKFRIEGNTVFVTIAQDIECLIDKCDLPIVTNHRWSTILCNGTTYACRVKDYKKILMHRQILAAGADQLVDHANRNSLDNRRSNIRIATHSQNMVNKPLPKNKWGFPGIAPHRRKWKAQMKVSGKRVTIGLFASKEEASAAYIAARKKQWGDFA
jgi:hypothetical protein